MSECEYCGSAEIYFEMNGAALCEQDATPSRIAEMREQS